MCKIVPRLKEIASNEGITIGTLERVIGASKGVLSRAINNGTDIQAKWLEAIVENYHLPLQCGWFQYRGPNIQKLADSSKNGIVGK